MKPKPSDFDEIIDRSEALALKFDRDSMVSIFGAADLWPSWVADMDFRAPPAVVDALARRAAHGVFGYEASRAALPAVVSAWYAKRHRWSFDPGSILFTPRTLNSLAVMVDLFSDEGDGVIVQPPVFYDFKRIIAAGGRRLVKNPLVLQRGRYDMDFDDLERKAAAPDTRLLILCNPHNPIGRVWSKRELAKLADICSANGVFVIADEIHGDLAYGRRYTPLASISRAAAGNSASCISPVKSFNLAGVANSMIVVENDDRRRACKNWYDRLEVNKNNVFTTTAMLAAYTRGEAWLDAVIDYLEGNVDTVRRTLEENIPSVGLVEPEGTYLLWLDFRELGFDPRGLADFLVREAKIAANPGHWFGREGAGFVRINIACPRSVLVAALARLERAVGKLAR